jgi:hypothetical protein
MALGPVAWCDEFTNNINAVTQLNYNVHRLHLSTKLLFEDDARRNLLGLVKQLMFPNILMKTLTIKDEQLLNRPGSG